MELWLALVVFFLGLVFSAIGWLLSNKDKKQGEEITQLREDLRNEIHKREADQGELYRLHNIDAQNLLRLELDITKAHHTDPRFTSLETTFKDGFKELGVSIREMMKDHVDNHHHNQ